MKMWKFTDTEDDKMTTDNVTDAKWWQNSSNSFSSQIWNTFKFYTKKNDPFINHTDKNKYGQTYLIISLNNQKKSTIIFFKFKSFFNSGIMGNNQIQSLHSLCLFLGSFFFIFFFIDHLGEDTILTKKKSTWRGQGQLDFWYSF